jgi:hypothetical protein
MNKEEEKEFREKLISIFIDNYGYTRDEAKIILRRIGDRLDGYTHLEAAERNPLRNEYE